MKIVITGASKGIGLAIAKKFVTSVPGIDLAICSRNHEEIQRAKEELESLPNASHVIAEVCDVSDPKSVSSFAGHVSSSFGAIDLLVNNAGYGMFKPVEAIQENEMDAIFGTNLRGVFLVTQAFLPLMCARRVGTIVSISSLAGKNGFAGGAAYCATKFGLRGLMQSLFLEVREDNIRVITILPGSVDTFFFERAHASRVRSSTALIAEDVAESVFFVTQLRVGATISELEIRPTNPKGA